MAPTRPSTSEPGSHGHHLGPIDACPTCGHQDFLAEERSEAVVFHCLGCATGWRYELGYVWAVGSDVESRKPASEQFGPPVSRKPRTAL